MNEVYMKRKRQNKMKRKLSHLDEIYAAGIKKLNDFYKHIPTKRELKFEKIHEEKMKKNQDEKELEEVEIE